MKKKDAKAIIKSAQDCLKSYQDRNSDNIKRAEEGIRFRALEQWPDAIKRDRENPAQDGGSRPCPVLDKTNQYVRQVINEERQNRAAIKIRPVDDVADPKVAEVYTGIIRHIEDASEAIVAYTNAGEHAIDGGYGYFRLITDYTDPHSFDQDIIIKRIHNRFSVALGPHTEADGADAKEALIWEDMDKDSFKKEFPDAKQEGFDSDDWMEEDTIRIAEYMCVKETKETIHLMPDGTVLLDSEKPKNAKPAKSRSTIIKKIKWYKLNSQEVLEEKDIPGQYIPVIKVTGNEITMPDGKIRLSGMIEGMMDSQRLHNYASAGFIENVALAPQSPWLAYDESIEDYEDEYAGANRSNVTLLKWKGKDDDGNPLPAPQRQPPPGLSSGWQQMLQNTEHGVEGSAGMYGPSVGAQSQEKSGIALQEQKAQGMVGTFQFPDNLSRSIQHCGRILLEWIPVYYDTERVARILGEDGEQELVYLNPEQENAVMDNYDELEQKDGQVYNLSVGKYDVTVTTGPSYTAKRQEAVDNQLQIIQARPEMMPLIGDILFKNMDAPGSDDIAERMKAMLPPEIKALEEKEGEPDVQQVEMMMQQIEEATQAIEQKGMELQEFEQQINQAADDAKTDKVEVNALKKELAAQQKVFDANMKVAKVNLEKFGMELVNNIEDATDPLIETLKTQAEPKEPIDGEEIEEPEVNPAMEQLLTMVAQMSQDNAKLMAASVSEALASFEQTMSAPRETTLIRDNQGNATGAVSNVR